MRRILLDRVPSTNDYALELLERERPPEHTAVQALEQTRGKGQAGGSWSSERGKNITLSVILYPTFLAPAAQFLLTQAVALAVTDVVVAQAPGRDTAIKWPNDVLLDGRKVCGILIESRISAARMEAAVVGIGLNVNQTVFPPDLPGAGSLALATGRAADLEAVVETLGERLRERYDELRTAPGTTEEGYRARLYGLGRSHRFRASCGEIVGTVTGVDPEGRLVVRAEDGAIRAYAARQIAWLR